MSDDLHDEITSINSIYGDGTLTSLSENSNVYSLVLPAQPNISLRIEFSPDYPDSPPAVLGTQSVGNDTAKGDGAQVVALARHIIAEVYSPGAPCIFDVIEESSQKLLQLGLGHDSREESQAAETPGPHPSSDPDPETGSDTAQAWDEPGAPPPWTLSDVFTEKKSIFVARSAPVRSVDEAKSYLAHLLATDKKVAKATHNITAWRIRGDNGVQYQDCDDDGEDAAGGRLLHLLDLMNAWDVMVVVSRWYGGVKLGPDRFRLINQCGRDAIVKGGFSAQEERKESGGKKGKK